MFLTLERAVEERHPREDVLIEMRYIRTGAKTAVNLKALARTCKSVRDSVGDLLRKAGVTVRLG